MVRRLVILLFAFVTIGLFFFIDGQRPPEAPRFTETVGPARWHTGSILHHEFLILMDEGEEKFLGDVLREFDLHVVSPLGPWTHVARNQAPAAQQIISLTSSLAREDIALLEKIEAHPAVHSAHLNVIRSSDDIFACAPSCDKTRDESSSSAAIFPHDPLFSAQWYLSKGSGINLVDAWELTRGNKDTVIAVVDRHFDVSEPDLSATRCTSRQYYYENILDYFSQKKSKSLGDDERHGAEVLSVLAPCTNNAVGLAGIDWYAQVFSVDSQNDASFAARMFGLLWAAGIDVCKGSVAQCPSGKFQKNMHPANIINASFGFAGPFLDDPPYGPVLDAIGHINRQGRIVVASAGNESIASDRRLPGSAGGVISVGASNKFRQSAYFSNFGRSIDVVAPGEHIIGMRNGTPIELNGTSFASPIVAGVASLMLAANPLLSWKHVEYILKKTATPMSCGDYCPEAMGDARKACQNYCCTDGKSACASGIIDAGLAVQMAAQGFPEVALVDVDDYFMPLSLDNDLKAKVVVKNWGGKKAIVRMKPTLPEIKIFPERVIVNAVDKDGIPGQNVVTVFYDDTIPDAPLVASFILEAANSDRPTVFLDQIEAIIEIVPDPKAQAKPKLLREQLSKSRP